MDSYSVLIISSSNPKFKYTENDIELAKSISKSYKIINLENIYTKNLTLYPSLYRESYLKENLLKNLKNIPPSDIIIYSTSKFFDIIKDLKKIFKTSIFINSNFPDNFYSKYFDVNLIDITKFHIGIPNNYFPVIGKYIDIDRFVNKIKYEDINNNLKTHKKNILAIIGGSINNKIISKEELNLLSKKLLELSLNHNLPLNIYFTNKTNNQIISHLKSKLIYNNIYYQEHDDDNDIIYKLQSNAYSLILTSELSDEIYLALSFGKPTYIFNVNDATNNEQKYVNQYLVDNGLVKYIDNYTHILKNYEYNNLNELKRTKSYLINLLNIKRKKLSKLVNEVVYK